MIRGQDSSGDARLSVLQIFDESVAIGSVRERLTHFLPLQNRVFEIDAKVGEVGSGPVCERQGWLLHKHGDDVRSQRTDFDVAGAFAELEGADDSVGNDAKTNPLKLRRGS